jgi:hypothetical protein
VPAAHAFRHQPGRRPGLSRATYHHACTPPTPLRQPPPPPEDSGFFKAIEEGKSEEEALALAQGGGAPTIHTPYEPARALLKAAPRAPVVAHSVVERRASRPCYGFAARFLQ